MTESKPTEWTVQHASDCAVHNAPALPPGPCDCGAVLAAAIKAGAKR